MEKDYHQLGNDTSRPLGNDTSRVNSNLPQPADIPVREVPQPTGIETREIGIVERPEDRIIDIAMVCHEANRAYCTALGDFTQRPWSLSPNWQQDSAINGVRAHLTAMQSGHAMTPRESHESWLQQKTKEGWVYGVTKNPVTKEHPCMVPYDDLPEAQRRKDVLFGAIVHALAGPL